MPYLPIDPADLGRAYDAVIRVNSQSGKGGIAYLLEAGYGIELPRRLQIDFARRVQEHTDSTGDEVDAAALFRLFERSYLSSRADGVELVELGTEEQKGTSRIEIGVRIDGVDHRGSYSATGPVEAVTRLLQEVGMPVEVLSLHQTSLSAGAGSEALTLIEFRDDAGTHWAAGRHRSVLRASVDAVLRAAGTRRMPVAERS